jgi:Protein of unknown function (DUF642)
MQKNYLYVSAVLLAVWGISLVRADTPLLNGSFESASSGNTAPAANNDVTLTPTSNPGAIANWTVTANQVLWIGSGAFGGITPEDGIDLIDLTGTADTTPNGTLAQTVTLTPGNSYSLSFFLGSDFDSGAFGGDKEVGITVTGSAQQTFSTDYITRTGNQWQGFTYNFVPTVASTTISIEGLNTGSGSEYLGVDNVSLSSVPEPISGGLWGAALVMGALGFARIGRRTLTAR